MILPLFSLISTSLLTQPFGAPSSRSASFLSAISTVSEARPPLSQAESLPSMRRPQLLEDVEDSWARDGELSASESDMGRVARSSIPVSLSALRSATKIAKPAIKLLATSAGSLAASQLGLSVVAHTVDICADCEGMSFSDALTLGGAASLAGSVIMSDFEGMLLWKALKLLLGAQGGSVSSLMRSFAVSGTKMGINRLYNYYCVKHIDWEEVHRLVDEDTERTQESLALEIQQIVDSPVELRPSLRSMSSLEEMSRDDYLEAYKAAWYNVVLLSGGRDGPTLEVLFQRLVKIEVCLLKFHGYPVTLEERNKVFSDLEALVKTKVLFEFEVARLAAGLLVSSLEFAVLTKVYAIVGGRGLEETLLANASEYDVIMETFMRIRWTLLYGMSLQWDLATPFLPSSGLSRLFTLDFLGLPSPFRKPENDFEVVMSADEVHLRRGAKEELLTHLDSYLEIVKATEEAPGVLGEAGEREGFLDSLRKFEKKLESLQTAQLSLYRRVFPKKD